MSEGDRLGIDAHNGLMFPTLSEEEIERLRGFGVRRSYEPGQAMVRAGESGLGIAIVVSGEVTIVEQDALGDGKLLVTHHPGSIVGEVAQLSGRPALLSAAALTAVDALVIPPEQLRALLVLEVELGERVLTALMLRRVGLMESGAGGPLIVGLNGDPNVVRLAGFLERNDHPFHQVDPSSSGSHASFLDGLSLGHSDLPVVLCPNGTMLRNPTEAQLAKSLGLVRLLEGATFDVVIIGAGPAGLATAVYAGSEGLSVLVLDRRSFGGQAGASARIENYLGFPTGIGGAELMSRAFNQAQKFGVETAIPDEVTGLTLYPGGDFALQLEGGTALRARSLVIAAGASYRRPEVDGLEQFEARCIHYWATPIEGRLCRGQDVVVVGGGNSAGQAVVYLAGQCGKVTLLVRGDTLARSMSQYLIERIRSLPNVEVVLQAELCGVEGSRDLLDAVLWKHAALGTRTQLPAHHLFLLIGAHPNTAWLEASGMMLDPKGYVLTGPEIGAASPLETSLRGAFAIGDVRSGSVKRVAAAVGEGAEVTGAVRAHLALLGRSNTIHAR